MNGLTRVANAMVSDEKRLEAITSNLANASTPGFKRRLAASHGEWVGRQGSQEIGLGISERNDFSQGMLQRTGNDLDLALEGEGFFSVEGPRGELYTRDGEFNLTSNGVLVTPEGFPVVWESQAGNIQPTGAPVTVSPDGTVSQGQAKLGKLKLVAFDNQNQLDNTSDGYWKAPATAVRNPATGSVRQGHLEGANVNAIYELVSMITVQRRFEQASQTMTQIDQSYRRLHQSR
ncbi:MAG TPA: flagellar basal-body rod protein FlgF [Planctomycetota bacterium]|nr:flagellar basal-body rod protein FlgF [Planctomycetota bacterium]HPF12643.1 flagellar basal-body rod protein FlgF [Planctomycetota bacterium]HRV80027.1 flagellar basal-body rod protein FlgF [Planctomycetota bacterium]